MPAPDEVAPLIAQAGALLAAGRLEQFVEVCRRIIAVRPGYAAAHSNLGGALHELGRLDEAVAAYRQAIAIEPGHAEARSNLGAALRAQGKWAEAVEACRRAVALDPLLAEAHCNLAAALRDLGRLDEAAASYGRALDLGPDDPAVRTTLGTVLCDLGRHEQAVACFRRVLALRPDYAAAHYDLGNALTELGRADEAAASYRRALALEPGHPGAHTNLGNALTELGRLDEAAACQRRALELKPDLPEAHTNLGVVLHGQGHLDEAAACHRRALDLRPDYAKAHNNLGAVLQALRRLDEAAASYRRAVDLKPDYAEALAQLVHQLHHLCDWDGLAVREEQVLDLVRRGQAKIPPFVLLSLPSSPAEQLACARACSDRIRVPPAAMLPRRPGRAGGRIRIGYLSADFRTHPVASLMAELIERHDRGRFAVAGYSIGPDDGSALRRRLADGFDDFVDLRRLSHREAAERIHRDGIDILVDLQGHTALARTGIAALRPAPVQVNFLGYGGTMGADFIDYVIADAVCIPPGQEQFYTEAVVRLPGCCLPCDTTRAIAEPPPSPARCGLPEEGFVFCCFNNAFKITPALFDIWMRLLDTVPGSVLWLAEANRWVKAGLRHQAAARGTDPDRLVFAPRLPDLADHLARYRLAGLFLDTLPYTAATTASDALWAGLPVLTCAGPTFVGRIAASLLAAIGLPELVTASLAEYEAMALRLATDPPALAAIRSRLAANRAAAFDIGRYTGSLEAAYRRMWELSCAGRLPEAFDVEAAVAPVAV